MIPYILLVILTAIVASFILDFLLGVGIIFELLSGASIPVLKAKIKHSLKTQKRKRISRKEFKNSEEFKYIMEQIDEHGRVSVKRGYINSDQQIMLKNIGLLVNNYGGDTYIELY